MNNESKETSNLFPSGISDKKFRESIINYFLGEDWYVADPLGQEQINEVALDRIKRYYKPKNFFWKNMFHEMKKCLKIMCIKYPEHKKTLKWASKKFLKDNPFPSYKDYELALIYILLHFSTCN